MDNNDLPIIIARFEDCELVQSMSVAFQKMVKDLSFIDKSEDITSPNIDGYISEIEGFVTADWQDDTAVMLCIKCEEPFNIDPRQEDNLVFCPRKRIFVPQCPHCGANDVET